MSSRACCYGGESLKDGGFIAIFSLPGRGIWKRNHGESSWMHGDNNESRSGSTTPTCEAKDLL